MHLEMEHVLATYQDVDTYDALADSRAAVVVGNGMKSAVMADHKDDV